ncbi:hypothetical protein [Flavobacterium pedocola]
MDAFKTQPELISYRQLRLIVGLIGFILPIILITGNCIAKEAFHLEHSISHYYHTKMGDVFVGMLCAVALFLFTYKGYDKKNNGLLSDNQTGNLACIFALGVAFFPTSATKDEITSTSWVHYISAGLFFSTLAYFSLKKFTKTRGLVTEMKVIRNKIYRFCGWTIVFSIVMLLLYNVPLINKWVEESPYFILFEILALWAFAFSWLVKAEVFFPDPDTKELELV